MISHSYQVANRSGLDVFWWDDSRQKGHLFKDRFYNAFQEVFKLGYQKIISVGGDCPGLTSIDIHSAANQIKPDQVVIGPASDGGIYLLGISRSAFESIDFNQIAWETPLVFQDIQDQLSIAGYGLRTLNVKQDLDNPTDIGLLLLSRKLHPVLLKQLLNLLERSLKFMEYQLLFQVTISRSTPSRAPPALAFNLHF